MMYRTKCDVHYLECGNCIQGKNLFVFDSHKKCFDNKKCELLLTLLWMK